MFHLFLQEVEREGRWGVFSKLTKGRILPFVPDLIGHWLLVEAADGSVGGLLRLPPPAHSERACRLA